MGRGDGTSIDQEKQARRSLRPPGCEPAAVDAKLNALRGHNDRPRAPRQGTRRWPAIRRALHAEIAAFAIVVDAKDDAAQAFYKHYGFIAFTGAPMTLYLPLAQAARAMGIAQS